jgi:hypothetical protein
MGKNGRLVLPLLFVACAHVSGESSTEPGADLDGGAAGASGDGPPEAHGGERASLGGSSARAGSGGTTGAAAPRESSEPYDEPDALPAELPARTFLLSHAEYAASAGALLGKAVSTSDFEPELDNGIYRHMSSSGLVRTALLAEYYDKARTVTDALDGEELVALVPNGELTTNAKPGFIEQSVLRAFRRPATSAELDAYGALFDLAAGDGDLALAFRTVLRALLTAPSFLYRTELGPSDAGDDFSLTDYEVASLLSYGLEGRPPSAALLEAADRGELTDPDRLAEHVQELAQGKAARASLTAFATEWLELDAFEGVGSPGTTPEPEKDPTSFPGFDAVRADMQGEALDFLAQHAAFGATLDELLTADVPAPAGPLAAFYRSDPSATGVGERHGVLALGAVLSLGAHATRGSPTARGLFVRERLLCQAVHPPNRAPPALGSTRAEADAKTTRELYALHASQAACAGCHALLDDIGFTLESFDGAGRFRTVENGVPIDTSGELSGTDRDGSLADHGELARALADSEWVRECVATQAFRYYFGELEAGRGAPPIQPARQALAGGSFGDALVALWSTASTYRRRREP